MTEPLEDMLKRHEGFRRSAYQDSAGYWTIGFGRMIDIRLNGGLTQEEALYLLRNDIATTRSWLSRHFPAFNKLDPRRQDALINMGINLGETRLRGFQRMWLALEHDDHEVAAAEMLRSRWADQMGRRAEELAEMMRRGTAE